MVWVVCDVACVSVLLCDTRMTIQVRSQLEDIMTFGEIFSWAKFFFSATPGVAEKKKTPQAEAQAFLHKGRLTSQPNV